MFRTSSATVAAASVVPTSDPEVPNEVIIFNFYQMHVHPVFHNNGYITTSYRGKANQPNLIFENTAYLASNLVVSRNVHLDSNVTPAEILIELRPITNNRYRSVYVCFPLMVAKNQTTTSARSSSSLETFLTPQANDSLSQQELNLTQYLSKTDDCHVKIDQTTRTAFITFSTPVVVHPGTQLHTIAAPASMPPIRMPRVTSQYKLKAVRVGDSMDDEYYNITMRVAHDVPSSAGTDVASGIIREGLAGNSADQTFTVSTQAQTSNGSEEMIMDCDAFDVDGETVQTLNIPIKSEFASEAVRGENAWYIAVIFIAILMMFVTHIAVIPLFYVQILPFIMTMFVTDFKEASQADGFSLGPENKRLGARIQLAVMSIILILAIILMPVGASSGDMNTFFVGVMFCVLFGILVFGNAIRTSTLEGAKSLVSWEVKADSGWDNVWAYQRWVSESGTSKNGFF